MSPLKPLIFSCVVGFSITLLNACGGGGGDTNTDPVVVETPTPTPIPEIPVVDTDGDSVADQFDLCANTQPGETVDDKGCSTGEISGQSSGFTSWGIGGGGAMAGYSINPFNDNMRFVGTDMGTVFRSLNRGVSWVPVKHDQTTYSSRLGYAAGFGFAGETSVLHAPAGVKPVRSIDGGQTFTAPASFELVYIDDGDMSNDEHITGWYSDTTTVGTDATGIVYAMTDLGLWRSTDAGDNWQFVYNGGAVIGMFIDNHNAQRIYIATQDNILSSTDGEQFNVYFTPVGHKVHRFSGGSTATDITLAYASDESSKAISVSLNQGLKDGDVKATYARPSNAGDEVGAGMVYVSKNNFAFAQTNQFVGSHMLMAQNDPHTIYATGSRGWGREKGTSVYVSEDGGDNWQLRLLQVNWDAGFVPWSGSLLEHSQVALNVGWYDAGYYTTGVNQLNSAQFGGSGNFFLHGSENAGNHWQDLTGEYLGETPTSRQKTDQWLTSGLNVTTVYDVKFNPANVNDIYAAYADIHGARSTDHGLTWKILNSPNNSIYDYAFDRNDATKVFMVTGAEHDWPYHSLSLKGSGGVFKSTNKGDNWQRLTPDNDQYNRQYLSIGYDTVRNDIYAGSQGGGISRSLDGGLSWDVFNQGLPSTLAGHDYVMDLSIPQIEVLDNGNVYALVTGIRPELTAEQVATLGLAEDQLIVDSSGEITKYYSWLNAAKTGIYLLDVANGATSWQLLRGNIDLESHGSWNDAWQPWKRPMSFAVDPQNTDVLWLTDMEPRTVQYGASGIWKSVDKGQNWQFILQHTIPLDISIAPNDSNYVVVAGPKSWGNGGVYVSKNAGQSWQIDTKAPLQNNANAVSFDPANTGKVVYGFFGGGMLYGDRL